MKTFQLPALVIEARGEVTKSNVGEFRELVTLALSGINRTLKTDEEFGQAEADVKSMQSARDAIKAAKEATLKSAESLHKTLSALDESDDEIRAVKASLEALIKARKEEVKTEIVNAHLAMVEDLGVYSKAAAQAYTTGLREALKGKRTVKTMEDACLQFIIPKIDDIKKIRQALDKVAAKHGGDIIADRTHLELQEPDWVGDEVIRRLTAKANQAEKDKLAAEARAAQSEAFKAKEALAEVGKPPAPPLREGNACPSVDLDVEDCRAEFDAFLKVCTSAFAAIKPAREDLTFLDNQVAVDDFRESLNEAWKILKAARP